MLRTHTCGQLSKKDKGKEVALCGWVDTIRLQKNFSFIDLRDRYGITQLFLDKKFNQEVINLKKESVIKIRGDVQVKPQPNPKLKTGEIEVKVSSLEVLNEAVSPLPLNLDKEIESLDETRLKYRYLDLRRPQLQNNLLVRHKIFKAIRDYLDSQDFIEVETPLLAKSTPEGARDYLVPSRIHPKKFFALPQSPQIFKQLLMIAGYDKYFQLAKCLRDEDLRADRQPEFTQLDLEMSFVEQEDIFNITEQTLKHVFKKVLDKDIKTPFPRITYKEAIKKYKTDKPDLRKDKKDFAFLWVVDFPLFAYSEEEKRYVSEHHPFTGAKESDIKFIEKNPEKVTSLGYDIVLNGTELGSGSIRINKKDLQIKVLKALGLSEKEINEKFGFLINSFSHGAPPFGGIALGLDRLVAIMTDNESIREVIAFPKNKDAKDLMLDSPSEISKEQLKELGIKFEK